MLKQVQHDNTFCRAQFSTRGFGGKRRTKMAITVNLRYTGKDGAAQAFAREMISSGTVEKIRAEKGNLRYEYYLPFGENDSCETILLIDSWENQEAIDLHHASPMMKTIASLREKYDLHMTIERFISDDRIPEQDKGFIRK
jgi:quinol monooxygenase YgiN